MFDAKVIINSICQEAKEAFKAPCPYFFWTSPLVFVENQRSKKTQQKSLSLLFYDNKEGYFQVFMYFCIIMGKKLGYNEQREDKKRVLWQQLEQLGCLWSYAKNPNSIDDSLLIEKALLYLEFEDLHKLSELYPLKQIQRVWRKRLVSQGDYYGIINWLLAVMFFDIKKPDQYLKRYGKPRLEIRA